MTILFWWRVEKFRHATLTPTFLAFYRYQELKMERHSLSQNAFSFESTFGQVEATLNLFVNTKLKLSSFDIWDVMHWLNSKHVTLIMCLKRKHEQMKQHTRFENLPRGVYMFLENKLKRIIQIFPLFFFIEIKIYYLTLV